VAAAIANATHPNTLFSNLKFFIKYFKLFVKIFFVKINIYLASSQSQKASKDTKNIHQNKSIRGILVKIKISIKKTD